MGFLAQKSSCWQVVFLLEALGESLLPRFSQLRSCLPLPAAAPSTFKAPQPHWLSQMLTPFQPTPPRLGSLLPALGLPSSFRTITLF